VYGPICTEVETFDISILFPTGGYKKCFEMMVAIGFSDVKMQLQGIAVQSGCQECHIFRPISRRNSCHAAKQFFNIQVLLYGRNTRSRNSTQ